MKFTPNDITPKMVKAAEMVFTAKAFVETIRPIVTGYQEKILKKHKFRQAAEWAEPGLEPEIITRVQAAFLMSDEDFKIYHAECNEERKKAGLKVEKEEHCPLCVAEHVLSQAESHLIDLFEPLTSISDYKIWGDNRKKYLDLTLKLLAPFVGKSDAILARLRGAAQTPTERKKNTMKLICPSCDNAAKFRVTCTTKAELDGGELLPLDGKLEIDSDGLCECANCDYTAPLPEFRTGGVPTLPQASE